MLAAGGEADEIKAKPDIGQRLSLVGGKAEVLAHPPGMSLLSQKQKFDGLRKPKIFLCGLLTERADSSYPMVEGSMGL